MTEMYPPHGNRVEVGPALALAEFSAGTTQFLHALQETILSPVRRVVVYIVADSEIFFECTDDVVVKSLLP